MSSEPSFVEWGWSLFDVTAADWLLGLTDLQHLRVAAGAALSGGCDSAMLAEITGRRDHDAGTILGAIFGACRERGIEFPLRDDAIQVSFAGTLAYMLDGSITAEEAAAKLWRLADLAPDWPDKRLQDFKELAISLDLAGAPELQIDLDLDEWRAEMVALARQAHRDLARFQSRQSRSEVESE